MASTGDYLIPRAWAIVIVELKSDVLAALKRRDLLAKVARGVSVGVGAPSVNCVLLATEISVLEESARTVSWVGQVGLHVLPVAE